MRSDRFEAVYEIEDGYVGAARPQRFTIDESCIDDEMSNADLSKLYQDSVEEAFRMDIGAYGKNEEEFVAWAKSVIAKRAAKEDVK